MLILAPLRVARGWPPRWRPRPRRWRGGARPWQGRPFLAASAAAGGSRSSGCCRTRSPRGPVPCGQSGPREDRRGSSRRIQPRSLGRLRRLRPAGFGWGRALGCGTRPNPPRAQPRLRSAFVPTRFAVRTHLRASFKSAEKADFQRRLSVRAFQAIFRLFRALRGL